MRQGGACGQCNNPKVVSFDGIRLIVEHDNLVNATTIVEHDITAVSYRKVIWRNHASVIKLQHAISVCSECINVRHGCWRNPTSVALRCCYVICRVCGSSTWP